MDTIKLRYRFTFRRNILMLFVLLGIFFVLRSYSTIQLLGTGLIVIPILYAIIDQSRYLLTITQNGYSTLKINYLFFNKKIHEFRIEEVKDLITAQMPNKFFGIYLLLNDGRKILLDSRPNLNPAKELKTEINNIFLPKSDLEIE